jgi:dihydroxyacetone kinase-like protein
MKKLLNRPKDAVHEMLIGFSKAYPNMITLLDDSQTIVRKNAPITGKVALISGGGSGHEPAHVGYVGEGMLDGAIAGAIFCAPSLDDVIKGIEACNGGEGILFIVKNYTGDNLLFDMAIDEAKERNIRAEKVVVADDIAIAKGQSLVGRRGVAGTVFVHKIAGALAERHAPLQEVLRVAQKVTNSLATIGMALDPCILPERGKSNFILEDDEIEIGIGIHGEPGIRKESIKFAHELVFDMMDMIFDAYSLKKEKKIAVMINGMGGTPLLELFVVFKEVEHYLQKRKINIHKSYVGEYMTSLEMAGCSITLLNLDKELISLLDAPCNTPGLIQK